MNTDIVYCRHRCRANKHFLMAHVIGDPVAHQEMERDIMSGHAQCEVCAWADEPQPSTVGGLVKI